MGAMDESAKRSYAVVGVGAIGGTIAFHLAQAGHRVLGVDVDAAHVAAIQRAGITIVHNGERRSARVNTLSLDEATLDGVSCVLVCVKGVGAMERATDWIAPRLAPDAFVVTMLNGLQLYQIAKRLGGERTVGAFVDFFADVVAPGVIQDGGSGTLRIGEIDGSVSHRVNQVVADLHAWGPAQATSNVVGFLWSKLAFSAMLTATALADAPMAELIDRHRHLMLALASEVFAIADQRGVRLQAFDAFEPAALRGAATAREEGIDRLVAWLRRQSKTRSGVWRDIAVHHRATEAVGRYAGLTAEARGDGLSTPFLDALVEILRDLEAGRRSMSEDSLRELWHRVVPSPL